MVNYFVINYKLKEHDVYHPGQMKDFSSTRSSYIANVVAESKDEAIDKLKDDFKMLTVEIDSVSDMKSMTDEEYENG